MAIRCSLLGHDYGDSEVEREREEQGNEVVVTIREEQTCSRCRKTKLVSENKEVTALTESADEPEPTTQETAGDVTAAPDSGGDAPNTEPAAAEGETPPAGGDGHDAEFVDEEPDDSDEVPAATQEAGAAAEADDEPEMDPEEDDAVILDADDEPEEEPERERAHGEWPDSDDTRADDDEPEEDWPAVEGEDEGYDADTGSGKPEDVEFGGGLRPESGGDADGEAVVERPEQNAETTFTSVDSAPTPVESTGDGSGSQYVCPECAFSAPGTGSSLRAGDICPECRSGYLAEQKQA